MTISYAGEVPNGSSFGCFWKILWKWRGSVYKLVWRELIAYLCVYYTINFAYRYALNDQQQKIFDQIRIYSGKQLESIPMSFVLGFYVSLIVKRWWEQYRLLPWPDTLALFISAAIPNNTGNNETGRLMRRNIMRYMVLAYVITLQRISLRVKRRFPTVQHLVDAGLMLESERKIFEIMNAKSPMSKYWMPLVWATNIINRARKDNLIASDHIVQTILMELSDIRRRLGGLIGYDTVCVPLVYTQVVTLVLYTYFIAALMGRQMVPKTADFGDLYFPLFTVLQFIFYVGWLKVAEVLINPFGEDDDDIELNWLIDRHIKAAYMIVDEMHEEHPELLKDQYWEEVVPKDLPYTVASEHYRRSEPKGSAENFKVKTSDGMYANIMPQSKRLNLPEDVYADYESVDTPMVERRKNWFTRQITRMGSVRSSSTAYSSGGLFNRNRINSVYSNPEAGGIPGTGNSGHNNGTSSNGGGNGGASINEMGHLQQQQRKMSLYDKFVNRKSLRAQRQLIKQNSKMNLNGAVLQTVPKNRPRIPTPDVTKESVEKENRLNLNLPLNQSTQAGGSVASGVALMASQMANTPAMYHQHHSSDVPVLGTLLLSPIKEMDSNSNHNTLTAYNPATAALAQSVLPKSLQNAGFGTVPIGSTSYSGTTNISTLSFPFAVTSTPDSISGALSIVSMVPANNVPQITATHSEAENGGGGGGGGGNMYPTITSFPVTLSLPRGNSTASITELLNEAVNEGGGGLLTVGSPTTEHLTRNSSLSKSVQDMPIYVLERKYSNRSHKTDENELNSNSSSASSAGGGHHINRHLKHKLSSDLSSSVSAPATLKKPHVDDKSGEVYV